MQEKISVWQGKGYCIAIVTDTGDTKCIKGLKIHCQLYAHPSNLHFRELSRTKEALSMTHCINSYIFAFLLTLKTVTMYFT